MSLYIEDIAEQIYNSTRAAAAAAAAAATANRQDNDDPIHASVSDNKHEIKNRWNVAKNSSSVGGITSGVGAVSNVGKSGVGAVSNVGISGVGAVSNVGISGVGAVSNVGISGVGAVSNVGISGVGAVSNVGISGVGAVSNVGISGVGAVSNVGISGVGAVSNVGISGGSGIGSGDGGGETKNSIRTISMSKFDTTNASHPTNAGLVRKDMDTVGGCKTDSGDVCFAANSEREFDRNHGDRNHGDRNHGDRNHGDGSFSMEKGLTWSKGGLEAENSAVNDDENFKETFSEFSGSGNAECKRSNSVVCEEGDNNDDVCRPGSKTDINYAETETDIQQREKPLGQAKHGPDLSPSLSIDDQILQKHPADVFNPFTLKEAMQSLVEKACAGDETALQHLQNPAYLSDSWALASAGSLSSLDSARLSHTSYGSCTCANYSGDVRKDNDVTPDEDGEKKVGGFLADNPITLIL
jgi:hypothetical protein